MNKPTTAYMVTICEYADYRVIAVLADATEAQQYADHHNRTNPPQIPGDAARVEEVPFYAPGWQAPPVDIIDGEVIDEEFADPMILAIAARYGA